MVEGVLTTALGSLEDGRGGFLADASAGIALLLPADPPEVLASGVVVRASGTVGDRYAQRTIRLDGPPQVIGTAQPPAPLRIATGEAAEGLEGSMVMAQGEVTQAPSPLASGFSFVLDDGSGPLRVSVSGTAGMPIRGDLVRVSGPLGQRDTTGSGTSGYRVVVAGPGSMEVIPAPSPSLTPSPSPSASPTPTAKPTPTPTPSPSPAVVTEPIPIAAARTAGVGARIVVEGVVTAAAGQIGVPALVSIQDATGAIMVRLPEGAGRPTRGSVLRVAGKLAEPYGQLEVRPTPTGVTVTGTQQVPEPLAITAATLGEGVEGRLVVIEGTLAGRIVRESSGDVVLRVVDQAGGAFRARAAKPAGITPEIASPGARLRLIGVVGQRASRKGAFDGYRVWLRDRAGISVIAPAPTSTPRASAAPGSAHRLEPPADSITIATALRRGTGRVQVEGVVTTPSTLLDASGRRVIIEDASAAVEVYVPASVRVPPPGSRTRVVGDMGSAYGAPRLRAESVEVLGTGRQPSPRLLVGEPVEANEGELVRVRGTVTSISRTGDRWRAEVRTTRATVVVAGLAGAGIPAAMVPVGADATIVGVVRRPHPSALDRRFAVAPRGPEDVETTPSAGLASPASSTAAGTPGSRPTVGGPGEEPATVDVDLAAVATLVGSRVRVGGIVVALDRDRLLVDDGTATGRIQLVDEASALLPLLEPGDAVGAAGRVLMTAGDVVVEVARPADIVRLGDLGESLALEAQPPAQVPAGRLAGSPGAQEGAGRPFGDGASHPAALLVVALLVVSGCAAAALSIHRWRRRRRLAARVAERLDAFAGSNPGESPVARTATPGGDLAGSVREPA